MKIFRIELENSRISVEGSERIGFKFIPQEGKSTDSIMHDWVIENLSGREIDLLLVPVAIDDYQTNFLGLLLALHIRLTSEIGAICRCPIIFYSYIPLEIICRISENYPIIFSKGSKFFRVKRDNISVFLTGTFPKLNDEEYKEFLEKTVIKAPRSFHDDNHSVANIWGAYILNHVSDAGVNLNNNQAKYLYFKWLVQKFNLYYKNIPVRPGLNQDIFLSQKKVALIDDEYEKGWRDVLFKVIEKLGGSLIVFENFKDSDKNKLSARVKKFVESNPDVDIYLVDLRLFETDHQSDIKSSEISGIDVIKVIKSVNGGNQVITFTASNKIWNLDVARKHGADGYYIKEAPGLHREETAYENYVRFIKELKRLISRAENLKPLYQNVKWVKNHFNFNPYSSGLNALPSMNSTALIKEEYAFLFETLNRIEDIAIAEKQQLRYMILLLVKILEIFEKEYIYDNRVCPILFKNGIELDLFKKNSKNIYLAAPYVDDDKYKSISNVIRAIDFQLFRRNNHQAHIQIELLITERNHLIHKPNNYNLNLNDILKWQNIVFDLLQEASRFRW